MKQALTEALAYLEREFGPTDNWPDGDPEWIEFAPLAVAARLVERLLPGVCENCQGDPHKIDGWTCHVCHGTGQVWDEGIVEAVAVSIWNGMGFTSELKPVEGSPCFDAARAVLSAIAQLAENPKNFRVGGGSQ